MNIQLSIAQLEDLDYALCIATNVLTKRGHEDKSFDMDKLRDDILWQRSEWERMTKDALEGRR